MGDQGNLAFGRPNTVGACFTRLDLSFRVGSPCGASYLADCGETHLADYVFYYDYRTITIRGSARCSLRPLRKKRVSMRSQIVWRIPRPRTTFHPLRQKSPGDVFG